MNSIIPSEISEVITKLEKAGFEAYLVGGCVRDLVLNREPKDWDIATSAKPEEIQKVFDDTVYENQFGTVGIKLNRGTTRTETQNNAEQIQRKSALSQRKSALDIVEVTTFRLEGKYTDKRHPDEIKFAKTIEEDLSRRDFTVNAMALEASGNNLVDPFGGQEDLKNKIIKTVGNPEERFNEDALRLLRAVRFAVELNFDIEFNTRRAIEKSAGLLEMIAKERIRDEFVKILTSDRAADGIILLEELDLLRYIIPELREGIGVGQNKHHIYTVFEHNLKSLEYAAKKNYSLAVRLASLLHDVGKPRTKAGEGPDATFYNHEVVGKRVAAAVLERLRFSKEMIETIVHLIRYHMFYYNVGEVSEAGVRRFLSRVGPENVDNLMKVREADRIGSGVPKAVPYKLRHLLFMIEKVKHDPLSPKMLSVNGNEVMEILGIGPSPRVGQILAILLEDVLDEPSNNSKENLESRIKALGDATEQQLAALSKKAKEKKNEFESGLEEEMKRKYYVR